MSGLSSRVGRLEARATLPVLGRFIYTRGPDSSSDALNAFLVTQGVTVGPNDMVFHDSPADAFWLTDHVGDDEPLTLVGVEPLTKRIEDMLAELD